jgi:hypothetical protein
MSKELRRFRIAGLSVMLAAVAVTPSCNDHDVLEVTQVIEAEQGQTGTLRLPLVAILDGEIYRLEARFIVDGPNVFMLQSLATNDALTLDVPPGDYRVVLQNRFQMFQETSAGLVPVSARLLSPTVQHITITGNETTRVTYRFSVAGGELEPSDGTLDIGFEVVRPEEEPVSTFDPSLCDFEDLSGCEDLACDVCAGPLLELCQEIVTCVRENEECMTAEDPVCGVRGAQGVPNLCTDVVERGGGIPPATAGGQCALELVTCLCSPRALP